MNDRAGAFGPGRGVRPRVHDAFVGPDRGGVNADACDAPPQALEVLCEWGAPAAATQARALLAPAGGRFAPALGGASL